MTKLGSAQLGTTQLGASTGIVNPSIPSSLAQARDITVDTQFITEMNLASVNTLSQPSTATPGPTTVSPGVSMVQTSSIPISIKSSVTITMVGGSVSASAVDLSVISANLIREVYNVEGEFDLSREFKADYILNWDIDGEI